MLCSKALTKLVTVEQLCIVVRDIDRSMRAMWETLGIGPWNISLRDPESAYETERITDMTYYDKPADFGFKVATTVHKLGAVKLELVQPMRGDNIYADFLRNNGEGIQHLGWYTVDDVEEFPKVIESFRSQGFPCIMSGRLHHALFAYVDTSTVLNTILEVVWRDPHRKPAYRWRYPVEK